jgi:hypothetical protein
MLSQLPRWIRYILLALGTAFYVYVSIKFPDRL